MIGDFSTGLLFWWRGWRHIVKHHRLLLVALAPVVISVGSFFAFIWILWSHLGLWVAALVHTISGLGSGFWYSLIYYPLVVGGGAVIFVAILYFVFIAHAFVAVPFYSLLADRTLAQLGKKPEGLTWRTTLRLFRSSLLKTVLLLAAGVLLFVLSFVPIVNIAAFVCAMLILAFDCMDYAFDGMGYDLSARLAYLWRERVQWLGMAGLALTLLVPGLTLLVTPGAVVGSALILKKQRDMRQK